MVTGFRRCHHLSLIPLRLDRGGGKDLSLKECPREQLEKEVRCFQLRTELRQDH